MDYTNKQTKICAKSNRFILNPIVSSFPNWTVCFVFFSAKRTTMPNINRLLSARNIYLLLSFYFFFRAAHPHIHVPYPEMDNNLFTVFCMFAVFAPHATVFLLFQFCFSSALYSHIFILNLVLFSLSLYFDHVWLGFMYVFGKMANICIVRRKKNGTTEASKLGPQRSMSKK